MITFESVGEYPNGYSLTSDELKAIHEVVSKDWSKNWSVAERQPDRMTYFLDVWPTEDDGTACGPHYCIQPDGYIETCPRLVIVKDPADGAWVADIPGYEWSKACWTQQEALEYGLAELWAVIARIEKERAAI